MGRLYFCRCMETKMKERPVKVAILDMYQNHPNQGLRNIKDIVDTTEFGFEYRVFDVRGKNEIPGLDYDIFISTGGPGSPYDGEGKAW